MPSPRHLGFEYVPGPHDRHCALCEGAGVEVVGFDDRVVDCAECGGTGYVYDDNPQPGWSAYNRKLAGVG